MLTADVMISDDEDNGDNEKDGNGWPAIPKMEMTEMSRTLYQQHGSTKKEMRTEMSRCTCSTAVEKMEMKTDKARCACSTAAQKMEMRTEMSRTLYLQHGIVLQQSRAVQHLTGVNSRVVRLG